MSSTAEVSRAPGSPPHVHHMDAPTAYQSAKFAMWMFLATELLLFGGLFVAFLLYRWMYLEEFIHGCKNLNVWAGATNTAVLLFSSFMAALAVDAAQRGQNDKVSKYLLTTLVCGVGFLVIKYLEYSAKVEKGIFPGDFNQVLFFGGALLVVSFTLALAFAGMYYKQWKRYWTWLSVSIAIVIGYFILNWVLFSGPGAAVAGADYQWNDEHFSHKYKMFYGLYYCMTGLHGLHVIIGMATLFWAYLIGKETGYSESYYTPVEVGALYWHLVDLIWIYLFPLLYLVGR